MLRKSLATTLAALVLAGSAMTASAGGYGGHGHGHGHGGYGGHSKSHCFFKKIRHYDPYYDTYYYEKVRICR